MGQEAAGAPLRVDWTLAEAPEPGAGGLAPGSVARRVAAGAPLLEWVRTEHAAGRLAFLDLPEAVETAAQAQAFCEEAPQAEDVVIAGVGGSALAARVMDALARAGGRPRRRLHVLDTVAPRAVEACWSGLDPGRTWLFGISKSGTTLEARVVFHLLEGRLRAALGAGVQRRVAVVTGEEDNALRRHAREHGYLCLPIPAGVGGRYSALGAVGLLPAAAAGLDPGQLLKGAAAARRRALGAADLANPALLLQALLLAAHESGRPVPVLWTYGEELAPLGAWWVQLLAESLGQRGPKGPVGPTPVHARGPADQHSLLQLLVDGPDRSLNWFLHEADAPPGAVVPAAAGPPGAGHTLGRVLAAEREATALALAAAGRPVVDLALGRYDAAGVGAFLLLWEVAVTLAGRALGVDPFGQPAVAWGKRAARVRLGAAGPEDAEVAAALARLAARPRRGC